MDAACLQRYELLLAVAGRRNCLAKLRVRMGAAAWAQEDTVYVAVRDAYDATHAVVRALAASEPKQPEKPLEPRPWMERGPEPPVVKSESWV